MLSLSPAVRVFIAAEPLDMRDSFDALAGAVRRLGHDPVDGHLDLFLNKRRRLAKALWFDGSGWCVLAKRLEAGSFQLPPFNDCERSLRADRSLVVLGRVRSGGAGARGGARRLDGSLWCTGSNDSGWLGVGDTARRSAFTEVLP